MRSNTFFVLLICIFAASNLVHAAGCDFTLGQSNSAVIANGSGCTSPNLLVGFGMSNSTLTCGSVTFSRHSSVVFQGGDSVRLYGCDFVNASIAIGSNSSVYLIGQGEANFTPDFTGGGSGITVAHYLNVNVFEPHGYNASSVFGTRAAGFSYILPLMNGTFPFKNSELVMSEFVNKSFNASFAKLRSEIPFGAYNITQSDIEDNVTDFGYGMIFGSKEFALPDYTIYSSGKRTLYNPYEIDYSFVAYDQLVMYTLNITRNTNLTPAYIQPIYPQFNFKIIPDNGSGRLSIRYLVAVPPQDGGWNFSAQIYKYLPKEFILNPLTSAVGAHSAVYSAFKFPGANYSGDSNGTLLYFVNYTSNLARGINSSIMILNGTIPGLGRFIQDSTTPTFSLGLGFCAIANDLTGQSMPYIKITQPGTYDMVSRLEPLAQPALPQLLNTSCTTGAVVEGKDININCDGGTINDTLYGIIITNSTDVSLSNCNIRGNGLLLQNSQGVSVYNSTFNPSSSNAFAVNIINSEGLDFFNITIGKGFADPFFAYSSAGTPESLAVNVYNISVCDSADLSAVEHFAYVTGSTLSCGFHPLTYVSDALGPYGELGLLLAALACAYAYIFRGRLIGKRQAAGRRRTRRKSK